MNNREKTLTTFLAVAVLGMIALIGAIMAKEQDIKRYKTILDIACQRTYNPTHCKSGMKMLMKMEPDEIKNYGTYNF